MRWLPALICWFALSLVTTPALAVGGAGALGESTHAGQGVGLPTTLTLGDLIVDQTFSRFGELLTRTLRHGQTTLFSLTLTRDALGRIATRELCRSTCTTWSYTYDAIDDPDFGPPHRATGRLIQALKTVPQPGGFSVTTPFQYTWDANGNRLTRWTGPDGPQAGTHDAQDRLLTWAGATFTHNAMGQRTAVVGGPDGDWTYTYDIFGNLLRAQQAGGDDVEYVVNASNQRIGRRVNGGPWTWWFYAGGLTPIAEYDADFRLRKVFVYGPGHAPDHVVTYDAAGVHTGRYRFVTDQVGSVLGLVDGGGAWVLEYDYTPFGRRTLLSAAAGVDESLVPFGFASGLHDPTTGLVRFGARDYDPGTARWMAKDPIDFAGGDTNLYAYVGGDPVNFIDPSGLQLVGLEGDGLWLEAGMVVSFGEVSAGLGDGVPPWVKMGIALVAEEAAFGLATGGIGTAARWAGRAWRWARGGSKAKLACIDDVADAARCPGGVCSDGFPCFVAGTPVVTEAGLKAIEDIEVGDLVLSRHEETDELAYMPVVRTFVTPDRPVLDLEVVDHSGRRSTLGATSQHPFWVHGTGWVPAGELLPGDELVSSMGSRLWVAGSTQRPQTSTVYNFEVEGFHTYFAGEVGAWVHNDCFERIRQANGMGPNARLTNDVEEAYKQLEKFMGVPRDLAKERLHELKRISGRGGADNVVFDYSGCVYSPQTGERLGCLSQGGGRRRGR